MTSVTPRPIHGNPRWVSDAGGDILTAGTVGGTDDLHPPPFFGPEVSVFASLGSWCFRRRKTVAIAWVVGVILVGAVSGAVGGSFGQDFNPPGFESTRGRDTLEETFGDLGTGIPGTVVFRAEQGVADPEVERAMTELFTMITTIAADPEVDVDADPAFAPLTDDARAALKETDLTLLRGITVISPYAPGPEPQIASDGPEAGKIAFASLEIPGDDWEEAGKIGRTLEEILPSVDGLQVELGGAAL